MIRDLPTVSIITPNYNYANFIGETIESVINQAYDNIEHIIVDDGSSDNSVEVINEYIDRHPGKIRLIEQENTGQTPAINLGLKSSKGEIIGWINSDDVYCNGAIKEIVQAFEENPSVDIVFGDLQIIDNSGTISKKIKQLPLDLNAGSVLGFGKLVASNTVFWRKAVMDKVGYLNQEFICNMDGEYFSRLFVAGKTLHIDEPIAKFRVHAAANSSDFNPQKMKRYAYELNFEIQRSYSSLLVSKVIPYKYSLPIKFFYKSKRFLCRLYLTSFLKWL